MKIERIVENALRQELAKALQPIVHAKVEVLFQKAISPSSPIGKKLEAKLEKGFDLFIRDYRDRRMNE
jgi:hypothetical protein